MCDRYVKFRGEVGGCCGFGVWSKPVILSILPPRSYVYVTNSPSPDTMWSVLSIQFGNVMVCMRPSQAYVYFIVNVIGGGFVDAMLGSVVSVCLTFPNASYWRC